MRTKRYREVNSASGTRAKLFAGAFNLQKCTGVRINLVDSFFTATVRREKKRVIVIAEFRHVIPGRIIGHLLNVLFCDVIDKYIRIIVFATRCIDKGNSLAVR